MTLERAARLSRLLMGIFMLVDVLALVARHLPANLSEIGVAMLLFSSVKLEDKNL